MSEECNGDEFTETTEATVNSMLENMSIAKGKGHISEDKYDEFVSQATSIREANRRLKCIVDNLPKLIDTPEAIIKDIDTDIKE